MATDRPHRTFAIERYMQRQAATHSLAMDEAAMEAAGDGAAIPASVLSQIMSEIKALRSEVKFFKAHRGGPEQPPGDADEAQLLRIEIARMIRSLAAAKREIAEIKHPMSDEDRVQQATNELDAIVGATEKATHTILDAAERINEQANKILETGGDDDELSPYAHNICNQVDIIFESCNFQDITGQRITRVVKTLNFIEERVKKIIADWGVEAFSDLPIPTTDMEMHATDDLVNGPQIEAVALSQDDIDALFG
ncbi:MAG: protein phosphatase CheZ [Rhodospirillum sp.]|nr:protein phosphatase CheZ [Rhodospirillum sp.]MCF8490263.1 protein phosphatase CheZ [Rhodospirillum sp.]MCF8499366.1 protein phosphatase CheZ [Rhodospirillum sp.]